MMFIGSAIATLAFAAVVIGSSNEDYVGNAMSSLVFLSVYIIIREILLLLTGDRDD